MNRRMHRNLILFSWSLLVLGLDLLDRLARPRRAPVRSAS
jgi:hypothetical protein